MISGIIYLQDFYLPYEGTYYEVKGLWVEKTREKIEMCIKEYGIKLS